MINILAADIAEYFYAFLVPFVRISAFTISAVPPVVGAGSNDVGRIVIHFFESVLFTVANAFPA